MSLSPTMAASGAALCTAAAGGYFFRRPQGLMTTVHHDVDVVKGMLHRHPQEAHHDAASMYMYAVYACLAILLIAAIKKIFSLGSQDGTDHVGAKADHVPAHTSATSDGAKAPAEPLIVTILHAEKLTTRNQFSHDKFYAYCKKIPGHGPNKTAASFQTTFVDVDKDKNATWNERCELKEWVPGNGIELSVLNDGLVGYKTEGRQVIDSNAFAPNGWEGDLDIGDGKVLRVKIECPKAYTLPTSAVNEGWEVAVDPASEEIYYYNHDTQERQWDKPHAHWHLPFSTH